MAHHKTHTRKKKELHYAVTLLPFPCDFESVIAMPFLLA
jgi:hypothetical protein